MGQRLIPYTVFLPEDVTQRLAAYAERSGEPEGVIAADAVTKRLELLEFVEKVGIRIARRKAEQQEGGEGQ